MINWTQGVLILFMAMGIMLHRKSLSNQNTPMSCKSAIIAQACDHKKCTTALQCPSDTLISFSHQEGELKDPVFIEYTKKDENYCLLYIKSGIIKKEKVYNLNNCPLIIYEN